jgi:hypothetical protein
VEYICWSIQPRQVFISQCVRGQDIIPVPNFLCGSLTDVPVVLLSTVACTYLLLNPMTGRIHSFEAIRHHPSPNRYASASVSCQEERTPDS